jgi:hypothetical protein
MPARHPLTGVITIDWVDAADPDDANQPPNYGWSVRSEPRLDDQRLLLLLRELINALEHDLTTDNDGHARHPPTPNP